MTPNRRQITILFLALFALFKNSYGINCYQCTGTDSNSETQFQCNEWLDSDIDIEPESCDNVYDAKYCIKHTGRFEGGVGTKRFCSSLDLGNYCNYVKQPGDKLESYRTCIFTCTGDGCNSGSLLTPTLTAFLLLLTLDWLIR